MNDEQLSEGETIRWKVKPNAFLYALETTRAVFLLVLCFSVILILFIHARDGTPMGFLIPLAATINCVMLLGSFALVTLRALGMVFIITNKRLIARLSVMARTVSQIAIPIDSIERIEVRCYGAQYGSVYFVSRPDDVRRLPPAILKIRPGWVPIWRSVPLTKPPMMGFYGFRQPETFAKLIVELQAAARNSGRL